MSYYTYMKQYYTKSGIKEYEVRVPRSKTSKTNLTLSKEETINLLHKLKLFIEQLGHFPSYKEFEEYILTLIPSMKKYRITKFRNQLWDEHIANRDIQNNTTIK